MSGLIFGWNAVAFDVSKGLPLAIDVYSIDLRDGAVKFVAHSMAVSFSGCYNRIVDFFRSGGHETVAYSPQMFQLHVARYRDNVYGLSNARGRDAEGWVDFFLESYSICFSMELSRILAGLSVDERDAFDIFFSGSGGGGDSSYLEAKDLYKMWLVAFETG